MNMIVKMNDLMWLPPDVGLTGSNAAIIPYGSVRIPTRVRSMNKVLTHRLYNLTKKTACRD